MRIGRKLNIVLLESDIVWGDKEANLALLAQKIDALKNNDVDLVILPELFSTGFINDEKTNYDELAEKNTGDTIRLLSQLAKKYHIAIIGSFIAKTLNHYYNRCFFIEPTGDDTFYDKRHLFSMADENKYFTAGSSLPKVIRFRGWNIMPIVCYDLRFPAWCRNINNKYDLLVVVANWPKAREYSWKQLLIARSIENECYVCGVNRTGTDENTIEYPLHSSMVIDFKGKELPLNEINGNMYECNLDIESLINFREKFPVWEDADKFKITI